MCGKLNEFGILGLRPQAKYPIAKELCSRLGFAPSAGSLKVQMSASQHSAQKYATNAKWKAANPDKVRITNRNANAAWKVENPNYFANYWRTRKADDPLFALSLTLRSHFSRLVRALDGSKDQEALVLTLPCGQVETFTRAELLGCSLEHFRAHIASLFEEGMTWTNHGEWHYDHKVPLATIGENPTRKQILAVSHWSNFQPMWAAENLSKGSLHEGKRHRLR